MIRPTCLVLAILLQPTLAEAQEDRPVTRPILEAGYGRLLIGADDHADFITWEAGAEWQYHELAAIGFALRYATPLQEDRRSDEDIVGFELRFTRKATDALDVDLGVGLAGLGFGSHIGFSVDESFGLAMHVDHTDREWRWLASGQAQGSLALYAAAIGYLFRWAAGFADD